MIYCRVTFYEFEIKFLRTLNREEYKCTRLSKVQQLNDTVVRLDVQAPFIAKKAKAGQFIILRIDERGERMPLTIADTRCRRRLCFYYLPDSWTDNYASFSDE